MDWLSPSGSGVAASAVGACAASNPPRTTRALVALTTRRRRWESLGLVILGPIESGTGDGGTGQQEGSLGKLRSVTFQTESTRARE